jgi:hypothetical protein
MKRDSLLSDAHQPGFKFIPGTDGGITEFDPVVIYRGGRKVEEL